MPVAYPHNEHVAVDFYPVDDKMGFEGMDTVATIQAAPVPFGDWQRSDQDREQLVMILSSLHSTEQAHPLLGNTDDVLLCG